MAKRWDVLALGAVAVDDFLYVDKYPPPDSKERVIEKRREGGGLAGTALVAASRMGASTAYLGPLGEDELSHFTRAELEREGVDCSQIIAREDARPAHSTIIVERASGRRTVFSFNKGMQECRDDEVEEHLVSACRVLLVDHTVVRSGRRAAEIARRHGIPVVADIERPLLSGCQELMDAVDHLVMSYHSALQLCGPSEPEAMVTALPGGPRACCVVTHGAAGCWYREAEGPTRRCAAYNVDVVDSTGCGDVFHGVYAAALARGLPVEVAIQRASAAAALKATHAGGRSGIPDSPKLEAFLRQFG